MGELVDVDKLVGLAELAREFGYNAEHLRQVAVTGKLRAVLVGGVWISTRDWMMEYMKDRKTEGWPRRKAPRKAR